MTKPDSQPVGQLSNRIIPTETIRFAVTADDGQELGRARLVIFDNDLRDEPLAYLEDVFVVESARGQGVGNRLMEAVITEARHRRCYKLVATSRFEREGVHDWYQRLGFSKHGHAFRLDLN